MVKENRDKIMTDVEYADMIFQGLSKISANDLATAFDLTAESDIWPRPLDTLAGLENCTRPLVFTSVSGCRASEYFDISSEN